MRVIFAPCSATGSRVGVGAGVGVGLGVARGEHARRARGRTRELVRREAGGGAGW